MRETLKVLIGLYNEKRLDPKATEITGLDFGLEKVLSSILNLEQRKKYPIISEKVNILSSFLKDKSVTLFGMNRLPLCSEIEPEPSTKS